MAKARKKAAKKACKGINKKTGKIKPGYRAVKGGCPRKVTKARKSRKK